MTRSPTSREPVRLEGAEADGGQPLRVALALSAALGRPFELIRIRARHPRPGLRLQDLDAVRAVALICGAQVNGGFEGSPDLRFEPGPVVAGEYRFDLAGAAPALPILQTVLAPLATAATASRVEITGTTHAPNAPSYEYVARHWAKVVERIGLRTKIDLVSVGFGTGGGEVRAVVQPWTRPAERLDLLQHGEWLSLHGVSVATRIKGDVARRQCEAAQALLWESRRLESDWELPEVVGTAPGAYLYVEASCDGGRAGFSLVGQRGTRPEVLGDRAARLLLRYLEAEAAIDGFLTDQLVVPLALSGAGGRVATQEVTEHLDAVIAVALRFDVPVRLDGQRGISGILEVA